MTTFLAVLAGVLTFLVTLFGLSIALGLLAEANRVFALMRVPPYRWVMTWVMFAAAIWLSAIVFGLIAG